MQLKRRRPSVHPMKRAMSFLVLSVAALGCSSNEDIGQTVPSTGIGSSSGAGGASSGTSSGAGGSGMPRDAGPEGRDGGTTSLEVTTWWSGMREVAALGALFDVHKAVHPDVSLVLVSYADQVSHMGFVAQRLFDGNPPAAIQAKLGSDALEWGMLAQALNAPSATWSSAFPLETLELLTFQGSLNGVPLSLTRMNVAYWNKRVLDTLTLSKKIPETLAEFDVWLREVSAAGYTHPLCFSGKDAWVSAHVLFEDIVPAVAGPQFSKDYWTDKKAADDPKIVEALDFGKKITSYLSPDWLDMDMAAGIVKLMARETEPSSQCLMTSMGDWGGMILEEQWVPDVDFVATGWPGTTKLTVFDGYAFLMPKGAAPRTTLRLLQHDRVGSGADRVRREGRGDACAQDRSDSRELRSIVEEEHGRLATGEALGSYKAISKFGYPVDPLAIAARDFFQSKDPTALLAFLRDIPR